MTFSKSTYSIITKHHISIPMQNCFDAKVLAPGRHTTTNSHVTYYYSQLQSASAHNFLSESFGICCPACVYNETNPHKTKSSTQIE